MIDRLWTIVCDHQRAKAVLGDVAELSFPHFHEIAMEHAGITGLCLSAWLKVEDKPSELLLHRPIGYFEGSTRWHELSKTNSFLVKQFSPARRERIAPRPGFTTLEIPDGTIIIACSGFQEQDHELNFLFAYYIAKYCGFNPVWRSPYRMAPHLKNLEEIIMSPKADLWLKLILAAVNDVHTKHTHKATENTTTP